MKINEIIIYIMVLFMVIGAIDRIIGNKFGLGEKFEEGILTAGTLALAMLGIISLAPFLATLLKPVIIPLFRLLGADPAMFAGSILANDMGGASLAKELALTKEAGMFGGLIVGSMLGTTIVFHIPVALGIIDKEDQSFLAKGVLAGMITIPFGSLASGIVAGFEISMIIINLIPIIIFSVTISLCLAFFENITIKVFSYFGKFVIIIITIGLSAAIIEKLTGLVVIPGMKPIEEGILIVGDIIIVLAGAFPLVAVITKLFNKPLMKLGNILGVNNASAAGMVACLANSVPMFQMIKDMDDRGKIINFAFAVPAAFVFGDHIGFTAGFNSSMLFPMIVGKLVGGLFAIIISMAITKNMNVEEKNNCRL